MNNQKDFQKRIENVENALREALEKNGLELKTALDFPKYRELPISLQLTLALLEEEGGKIVRQYSKITKSEPPKEK